MDLLLSTNVTSGSQIEITNLDESYNTLIIAVDSIHSNYCKYYFQGALNTYNGSHDGVIADADKTNFVCVDMNNATGGRRDSIFLTEATNIRGGTRHFFYITAPNYAPYGIQKGITWRHAGTDPNEQRNAVGLGQMVDVNRLASFRIGIQGNSVFTDTNILVYGVK